MPKKSFIQRKEKKEKKRGKYSHKSKKRSKKSSQKDSTVGGAATQIRVDTAGSRVSVDKEHDGMTESVNI